MGTLKFLIRYKNQKPIYQVIDIEKIENHGNYCTVYLHDVPNLVIQPNVTTAFFKRPNVETVKVTIIRQHGPTRYDIQ